MDPRLQILLEDARHERLQNIQLINLQKYTQKYGIDIASIAIRKGISKKCRGNLKMPDINLEKACPELRSKDGDMSVVHDTKKRKMRSVHNSNMRNIQETIETARKNMIGVSQRAMIDKFLTGNVTSVDVKATAYEVMRKVLVNMTGSFESNPTDTALKVLVAGGGVLYGGAKFTGGVTGVMASSVFGVTALATTSMMSLLEVYRQLRVSYPWLPTLRGVENLPSAVFNSVESFARAVLGSDTNQGEEQKFDVPTPSQSPPPDFQTAHDGEIPTPVPAPGNMKRDLNETQNEFLMNINATDSNLTATDNNTSNVQQSSSSYTSKVQEAVQFVSDNSGWGVE